MDPPPSRWEEKLGGAAKKGCHTGEGWTNSQWGGLQFRPFTDEPVGYMVGGVLSLPHRKPPCRGREGRIL